MKRHNAQLCLVPVEGADAAVHNLVDAVREGDHSCGDRDWRDSTSVGVGLRTCDGTRLIPTLTSPQLTFV
ncbi:hypothetical protein Naga_100008g21 [Nannochloropsis gaditana]|uniref:Uncharacterized protein n=1 Tax=Nannochloropsis gaditana TaxID=72520 RepID=W7TLQ1_9STRA|nr:hypothetical protein Naga_100008g21 [Nannochloropsis gaditana]